MFFFLQISDTYLSLLTLYLSLKRLSVSFCVSSIITLDIAFWWQEEPNSPVVISVISFSFIALKELTSILSLCQLRCVTQLLLIVFVPLISQRLSRMFRSNLQPDLTILQQTCRHEINSSFFYCATAPL